MERMKSDARRLSKIVGGMDSEEGIESVEKVFKRIIRKHEERIPNGKHIPEVNEGKEETSDGPNSGEEESKVDDEDEIIAEIDNLIAGGDESDQDEEGEVVAEQTGEVVDDEQPNEEEIEEMRVLGDEIEEDDEETRKEEQEANADDVADQGTVTGEAESEGEAMNEEQETANGGEEEGDEEGEIEEVELEEPTCEEGYEELDEEDEEKLVAEAMEGFIVPDDEAEDVLEEQQRHKKIQEAEDNGDEVEEDGKDDLEIEPKYLKSKKGQKRKRKTDMEKPLVLDEVSSDEDEETVTCVEISATPSKSFVLPGDMFTKYKCYLIYQAMCTLDNKWPQKINEFSANRNNNREKRLEAANQLEYSTFIISLIKHTVTKVSAYIIMRSSSVAKLSNLIRMIHSDDGHKNFKQIRFSSYTGNSHTCAIGEDFIRKGTGYFATFVMEGGKTFDYIVSKEWASFLFFWQWIVKHNVMIRGVITEKFAEYLNEKKDAEEKKKPLPKFPKDEFNAFFSDEMVNKYARNLVCALAWFYKFLQNTEEGRELIQKENYSQWFDVSHGSKKR